MIPENVNEQNVDLLMQLVINGTTEYPGALYYEEKSKLINLQYLNP